MMQGRLAPLLAAMVGAVLLSACAAGPDYHKPEVTLPVSWQTDQPWRPGTPGDDQAKGAWWERFGDAQLNALQQQALAGNQTLAVASARLAQARASANAVDAGLYPTVGVGTRASRLRISGNRPLTNYRHRHNSRPPIWKIPGCC